MGGGESYQKSNNFLSDVLSLLFVNILSQRAYTAELRLSIIVSMAQFFSGVTQLDCFWSLTSFLFWYIVI